MTQSWREYPKLQGRFHPDAEDDVQVVVHDGGPRLTDRSPEAVWVTVTGCASGDILTGRVLNQPQQLLSVSQGAEIKFVVPSGEHLLMVTDKYLSERPNWKIHPCNQCGLDELFDAPSDLIRVIFPDLPEDAVLGVFTSFCGVCGGVQIVQDPDADFPDEPPVDESQKKWWQFWK
jgi:hypothetical protein